MTLGTLKKKMPEYIEILERAEYSVNTIKKYSLAVRNFIEFVVTNDYCEDICKDCLIEYKKYLNGKYAPNTANLYIVALNKYLHHIGESELCVKTMKIQTHNSLENCLTIDEYHLMLQAAQKRKNNTIYYIMHALAATGIRLKELEYFTFFLNARPRVDSRGFNFGMPQNVSKFT